MLKTALAIFTIACMAAWGQAQTDTTGGEVKVDRASAYYHYTLACIYREMAAAEGRNPGVRREYEDKAIENYKAALKADPQTPSYGRGPVSPLMIFPGRQPSRTLPKVDPVR
jgi:hypothetical protein